MKKIIVLILILSSVTVLAQDDRSVTQQLLDNNDLMKSVSIIFVMYLFITFILTIIRLIADYRIKSKMLEKSTPENLVSAILQSDKNETRNLPVKWFAVLSGIGVGLLLITLFPPYGMHSLAIMVFSVALSFLGYYIFTKRTRN